MKYTFSTMALILCSVIFLDSAMATDKYDDWINQLEKVQGKDSGSERVNRDRLLSAIIDPSKDMFSFRVFYSEGRPRIDSKRQIIGIGKFKDGYRGGATEFVYTDYVWDNGLRLSSNGR